MTIDEFLKSNETRCDFHKLTMLKIKYNENIDFLYIPIYSRLEYDNDLKFIGMFERSRQKLYGSSFYFNSEYRDSTYSEFYQGDISKLEEELQNDTNMLLENYIKENKQELINLAKPLYDKYISYDTHYNDIKAKAVLNYIYDTEIDKDIKFTVNLKNNDLRLKDTIIEYLENPKEVANKIYNSYIENYKTTIYTRSCEIPNINDVGVKENIGFRLLVNKLQEDLVKGLQIRTHNKYKKKHDIIRAIKDLDAQNITITIKHNNKSLDFKYPKAQLYNSYMSDWYIPDLDSRKKLKDLYPNERPSDDEYIKDIFEIKYRNKTIYKDISMQSDLTKDNKIEDMEMECE